MKNNNLKNKNKMHNFIYIYIHKQNEKLIEILTNLSKKFKTKM